MLDALVTEARVRWGLDPAGGLQVVATERLIATSIDPARALILAPAAMLGVGGPSVIHDDGDQAQPTTITPLPGRHGPLGLDAPGVLGRLYPPDHAVGRFGQLEGTTIGTLTSDDLAGPLFVASVAFELAPASPWALPWISNRLRAPDGCPWDREQTHASLRGHLLEETYEVYDALERPPDMALADELGDLLLQVILHAQLAAEEGIFDLTDVQAAIGAKIVRRHPHVFGDAEARTATDVNRQWERIKADERAEAATAAAAGAADAATDGDPAGGGVPAGPKSALDGIGRSLPALAASQEMQERAAHLGYDWPTVDDILKKVNEEIGELRAAETPADRQEELGDLLMVLVNIGRRYGVQAEAALRTSNDKFRRRFGIVERLAAARGVALRDLEFADLDALWDTAKADEREGRAAAVETASGTAGEERQR